MKQIELKPIQDLPDTHVKIKEAIIELFRKEIYYPLIIAVGLKKKIIKNSLDDLLEAIRSGQISFSRGSFEGKFNSVISRELKKLGAVWDRGHKAWKINKSELSIEIKNAISVSEQKFRDTLLGLDKKLEKMVPAEIAEKLKISDLFDTTLWKVEKEFKKNIENITIAPTVTPEQRRRISDEYTKNMQLYIKDFTEKEIIKLRKDMEESAFSGFRYESMISKIKESYGVSVNKARFLARQETKLLVTKYTQTRYEDAGVNEYRWATVHMPAQGKNQPYQKGEVRYHHALLNGKIFSWSNPPIVNDKGERKNPGQDYGCRCKAIPVVRF